MTPLAPISKQQEMRKILIDFIVKALGTHEEPNAALQLRRAISTQRSAEKIT